MEKPPKTVMIPLYITHADTGDTRDLCAYLQKALHIDIDPDVGPNTPGVSELRIDTRRVEHAAQYPNQIDPMLDPQVLVDVCQPHFEAGDYFWPTTPGRYTLWHATLPCAVFVLTDDGAWVRTDDGAWAPYTQSALQGAGWIGARVGAKPAEVFIRCSRSVGKSTAPFKPASYVAHPAPAPALVAGENLTLRTPSAGGVGKTELSPWPATYVLHPGQAVEIAIEPLPVPTQPAEPQQASAPPPGADVVAAKQLIADAKAAYAAATKGSRHANWAFDFGPRLWALATQLLDERPPQIQMQGEKHDDTRTTESGGSEPGHAGFAAPGD